MTREPLNFLGYRDEEISIRISPEIDKDKWTGNLHLTIDAFDSSPLSDVDYFSLMNFVRMIMATPVLIEEDEEARDKLWEIAQKDLDPPKKNGKIIGRDGNIIKLHFNKKTDGSA
tara:strand:+ start:37 stop:381 length:345 start_codon:yes stop_codon:yes gene_type:complete